MAQTTTIIETWKYRDPSLASSLMQQQVIGYSVEALDGSIGKIDDATLETGSAHIVVDTGPWIFGKKVMLPAGVIRSVDHDDEKVFVNRTKDADQERTRVRRLDAKRRDLPHGARNVLRQGGRGYRDWD